jgi:beta-barrel assembly-enhancing protease
LSYTREAEEEADAGAVEMLQRARIDTGGFARFFEREDEREKKSGHSAGLPSFFRSHPPMAARRAAIPDTTGETRPALAPAEWSALKAICGSLAPKPEHR